MTLWTVWGPSYLANQHVKVDEGLSTEAEAQVLADRRNTNAKKFNFVGGYIVLPADQDPNEGSP